MNYYRYYVRLLPNGKALQCPGHKGILMDLYFTTIMKLTGLSQSQARERLENGGVIRAAECEFWAVNPLRSVIVMQPRRVS